MSDIRDPERDQQLPEKNDNPYIQDLVIADLEERKRHGIRKYGTALQAGNGREMMLDAYEEAMDLLVYLKGHLEETRTGSDLEPLTPQSSPEKALARARFAMIQVLPMEQVDVVCDILRNYITWGEH